MGPQPQLQPQPQPQQNAGDCVSIGPSYYAATCAAVAANCETYSTICKRVPRSGGALGPAPATVPCIAANDPIYSAACKALAANCEQYSFCTRASLPQRTRTWPAPSWKEKKNRSHPVTPSRMSSKLLLLHFFAQVQCVIQLA